MAAITAKEKNMLKVLGVILLFMAVVWGRKYMKGSGGSSDVRGRRRSAATASRRTTTRTASRGRAAPAQRKKKQVLTPRDIPNLSENLKLKLKNMKNPDLKMVNDDQILYETTNIWLPIGLNDRQVEKMKREQKAAAMGSEMMADTIFFRGVAHVGGQRLAILERADRTIPWYVKEGELLDGTAFVVTNIANNDLQVTLMDNQASRERDKFRTIPWSGIDSAEELAAQPEGQQPGATPDLEMEASDIVTGEDDFEIME